MHVVSSPARTSFSLTLLAVLFVAFLSVSSAQQSSPAQASTADNQSMTNQQPTRRTDVERAKKEGEDQGLEEGRIKRLKECSVALTNKNCKLVVDRNNPMAPPIIQMYSDRRITVVVKNPKIYERYFLDYQSGQATALPDVASGIAQGLFTSAESLNGEFKWNHLLRSRPGQAIPTKPCSSTKLLKPPAAASVKDVVADFQSCLEDLLTRAGGIYRSLEPFIAPDALNPVRVRSDDPAVVQLPIADFVQSEVVFSGQIAAVLNDDSIKKKNDVSDNGAMVKLTDLQKMGDVVANDLMGYSQRIKDINDPDFINIRGFEPCENLIELTSADQATEEATGLKLQCVAITSRRDDDKVYANMTSRTVTYYLNTLNLISISQQAAIDPTKKKSLATVALNFADKPIGKKSAYSALRWEASAGAFFSTLPIRSFAVAPTFTSGVVTDNTIQQSVLHPTVEPFAAANYRLTNYFHTRWNSALYATGGIGVNPNTVSADFVAGPSVSWRLLMVSALWHYGHDTRLTQGLTRNQSLGASFGGTVPTQTYWTSSFAVGVSVRIPSLTGR